MKGRVFLDIWASNATAYRIVSRLLDAGVGIDRSWFYEEVPPNSAAVSDALDELEERSVITRKEKFIGTTRRTYHSFNDDKFDRSEVRRMLDLYKRLMPV